MPGAVLQLRAAVPATRLSAHPVPCLHGADSAAMQGKASRWPSTHVQAARLVLSELGALQEFMLHIPHGISSVFL